MASFDINFSANSTGTFYVGYRTYTNPANTYDIVNVDVTTPGAQTVTVDVPGSLWCADSDIEYTGYIINSCQDQTDGNADGVPDLASTWSITLVQQTDDCVEHVVTCVGVDLAPLTVTNGGSYYVSAPNVTITGCDGTGSVTANLGSGFITSLVSDGLGAGYAAANGPGTQTGIPLVQAAGGGATTGTLCTVDVTFDGSGNVTNVVLNGNGNNYVTYENPVTIDETALSTPGAPTTEELITLSTTVGFADEVIDFSYTSLGNQDYTCVPTVTIDAPPPGPGVTATADANLADCYAASSGYETTIADTCAGEEVVSGSTVLTGFQLGDFYTTCASLAAFNLLETYGWDAVPVSNCRCAATKVVTVEAPSATAGYGYVHYNTSWNADGAYASMVRVTQQFNWDDPPLALGCVIESTVSFDNETLVGGVLTKTNVADCP